MKYEEWRAENLPPTPDTWAEIDELCQSAYETGRIAGKEQGGRSVNVVRRFDNKGGPID